MADEAIPQATALPVASVETEQEVVATEFREAAVTNGLEAPSSEAGTAVATETKTERVAPNETAVEAEPAGESTPNEQATSDTQTRTQDKPASILGEDIEMDDIKTEESAPGAADSAAGPVDTPTAGGKSKARRKSSGVPEHKKKLNRKASKAKMTHTDAKPGDYFYIRLKGYPLWPGIVVSEDMLPEQLLKSRPGTAADRDGNYRADFADGGKRVSQRSFPVMYLHTNEFSWIPNTDLVELDLDTVSEVSKITKKDLIEAHLLAAEKHDLDYFKTVLIAFKEEKVARAAEKDAEAEAKAANAAKKAAAKAKPRKSLSKAVIDDGEDVEMADVTGDAGSDGTETEGAVTEKPKKKSNKRKADEDGAAPQRADSIKKPKTTLKINNTPKVTNGTATLKSAKDSSGAKSAKPKKKATPKAKEEEVPKEPELSPEEKRQKKAKEILFLRHKLQKGLLTRDQEPKEEEMKPMAEFVTKLEGYADLEVSIIRATKINKVLKAILKLNSIPKEEEFQFKARSQTLLDKWNKLLASEASTPVATTAPATNGIKDDAKPEGEEEKAVASTSTETSNGVKEDSSETKTEVKVVEKTTDVDAYPVEPEEVTQTAEVAAPVPSEESTKKAVAESAPVESTA